MSKLPALSSGGGGLPVLPGGALSMAGSAAAGFVGGMIGDSDHQHKRRRRRKGITAKDLTSFKRVARLVDKYAKPVHHFRNIKK